MPDIQEFSFDPSLEELKAVANIGARLSPTPVINFVFKPFAPGGSDGSYEVRFTNPDTQVACDEGLNICVKYPQIIINELSSPVGVYGFKAIPEPVRLVSKPTPNTGMPALRPGFVATPFGPSGPSGS